MIQRDYIMTMIEQLGRLLGQLLMMKKAQKLEEAVETIDKAGHLFFGIDIGKLPTLTDAEFIDSLKSADSVDPVRCAIVALLLNEQAEIFDAQGKHEESYPRYMKALIALLELHKAGVTAELPENIPTVERIAEKLEAFDLPTEPRKLLFDYFAETGAFARAEDMLLALFEADQNRSDLVEFALQFYEQLLHYSDAELEAGNLPRDEVEEGLATMRERAVKSG